ncbi:MAG: ABC transporter permease [Ruminococcaceae bacterium]|nr:ABC transporter permease [Oscillospiraceae bacterium]
MEFLRKLKNSIKSSVKSVLINYKEFIGLYAAVIVVQLLLGIWTFSAFTNYNANDAMFEENYKYDITITGTNAGITTVMNRLNYDLSSSKACFTSFGYAENKNTIGANLKGGALEEFTEKYLSNVTVQYQVTPKYTYRTELRGEILLSSVIIGAIAFLIGTLIIGVIYSVRTNHYKFQYGIYMTFGADKKMLGKIAMNELLTINLLTLVPSAIISYLLTLIVYANSGVAVKASFLQLLLYAALTFIAAFVAACSSLGSLFIKPPIALITTADNSNFVSSPRRSFNIFAKKMPLNYEAYTTWRFRKYVARLVLGAVCFSVIFVTGIYCTNMLKTENEAPDESIVLTYKFSTILDENRHKANEEAEELIDNIGGVDYIDKVTFEQSKSFDVRMDHLLIRPGTEVGGSNFTVVSIDEVKGYNRATNRCRYVCVDILELEMYESLYDVEYLAGYDAQKLLADDNMIIISEGLYGTKSFDFKPGDTVVVADWVSTDSKMLPQSDANKILTQQIYHCSFNYTEYVVGAVIHDTDATDSIIIGMNSDTYCGITNEEHSITELKIFSDSDIDLENVSNIRSKIKTVMENYPDWSVAYTNEDIYSIVDNRVNLPGLLYLLSILVLMISPVVWIFSQVMFYKKREAEFRTLGSIGATLKEIGGIHAVSGVLIFAISFVVNLILSRLTCYGIYRIFTSVLPRLGVPGMNVSFNSFVPFSTILLYAGVSALCGCISSLIPFLLYKRKLQNESKLIEAQKIEL